MGLKFLSAQMCLKNESLTGAAKSVINPASLTKLSMRYELTEN